MKEPWHRLNFFTVIVFFNVYNFSNGDPHNLKRPNPSSYIRNRLEDLVNLPRGVNSFDVDDVPRIRNSRSAAASSLQSPVLITNHFHQRHDHQDNKENPPRPKFETKNHVAKVKDSGSREDSNNTTRFSSASGINDKNNTRAIEAMLNTLHLAPALTKEVYRCLKDSPAYQALIKSLQLSVQATENNDSHSTAAR